MCNPEDGESIPSVPYRTPIHLKAAATAAEAADGDVVIETLPITFQGYIYKHATIAYVKGRQPAPVVLIHPNYAGASTCYYLSSSPHSSSHTLHPLVRPHTQA